MGPNGLGDEMYGATCGTLAEFAVAPVSRVAPKPPQLSFEEAAVLPYPTFVTMQALREHGRLHSDQHVLVVGASGALGAIVVQVAAAFGATVTGVCSGGHAERTFGVE